MEFFKKNLFNVIMLCVIAYLAYQKFIVNKPEKNIDLKELSLVTPNGDKVNMESLRGKVLFINFYSSWCGPCMVEMPSIHKLYKEFKEEDVEFLLVNTTSLADIKKFQDKKKYEIPQYLLVNSGSIPIKTIPLTYVINKNGDVVKVVNRPKDWYSSTSVKTITELL